MHEYEGIGWGVLGTIFLCTLVLAISSCTVKQSKLIAQMAEKGEDPMRAACAVRGSGSEPWCVIAATNKETR